MILTARPKHHRNPWNLITIIPFNPIGPSLLKTTPLLPLQVVHTSIKTTPLLPLKVVHTTRKTTPSHFKEILLLLIKILLLQKRQALPLSLKRIALNLEVDFMMLASIPLNLLKTTTNLKRVFKTEELMKQDQTINFGLD